MCYRYDAYATTEPATADTATEIRQGNDEGKESVTIYEEKHFQRNVDE